MIRRPGGDRTAARRFVLRLLCLVAVPLLLIVAPGEFVLWRLADGIYPTRIAQRQHDDPHLAWIGPLRLYAAIKVARMQLDAPEIAVIGASRAGQFRAAMFKPYRFYNAAMSGWSMDRQRDVLDRISASHAPRIVILNLDYFAFSQGYDTTSRETAFEAGMPIEYSPLRANLDGLNSLAAAVAGGHWQAVTTLAREAWRPGDERLDGQPLLGSSVSPGSLTAFRHDGSMSYFTDAVARARPVVERVGPVLEFVEAGKGAGMDRQHVDRLRGFIELAKQRGIRVVGVQLPLPKAARDVLDAGEDYSDGPRTFRGSDMKLWRDFEHPDTAALFERLGIIYCDLARIPEAANPQAFIDPMHPGEYLVLAAVIAMLRQPRLRALLPDIDIGILERIKQQAEARQAYFQVFRDQD